VAKIGHIAFVFGVIVSIVTGFFFKDWLLWLLTVLGIIVGFLNIATKEVQSFLLAAVSLVIISAFGGELIYDLPRIGPILGSIYISLLTFVAPAAIVVALKSLYQAAKD
jgi:hypothetical protein